MSETPTLEEQVIANLFSAHSFTLNESRTRLRREHKTLMSANYLKDELEVMKKGLEDTQKYAVESESFQIKINGMMIDKLRAIPERPFEPDSEDTKYGLPGTDLFLVRDIRSTQSTDKGFVVDARGRIGMGYLAYESLCYKINGPVKKMWGDNQSLLDPTLVLEDWIPFGPAKSDVPYQLRPGRDPITTTQYNTFAAPDLYDHEQGFVAPYLPEHIKKFLLHLVDNNEEQFHILLWWIKMLITGTRANNIFILSGRGGTGKTIFYDKLLTNLLGSENITMTDAVNLAKETTNKEFHNKILVTMEETGISQFSISKMKQMAADWIRIRPMHCDPIKVRNRTNLLILTNPDTGKIHANANERRFWAADTTSKTLEEMFGPQSQVIEDIKSGKEIGNFYAWLQEYEPKFPLTSSEIKVNNRKFFELVVDAYPDRGDGQDELLSAMVASQDMIPLASITYNRDHGGKDKAVIKRSVVRDFLNGWKEVHPDKIAPGKLIKESGIWYVKSNIRSIEELTNCQTPGYIYDDEDDDLADILEPSDSPYEDF